MTNTKTSTKIKTKAKTKTKTRTVKTTTTKTKKTKNNDSKDKDNEGNDKDNKDNGSEVNYNGDKDNKGNCSINIVNLNLEFFLGKTCLELFRATLFCVLTGVTFCGDILHNFMSIWFLRGKLLAPLPLVVDPGGEFLAENPLKKVSVHLSQLSAEEQ